MINRYNIDETTTMLTEAGFEVQEIKDEVYAGQGMFFVARKPLQGKSQTVFIPGTNQPDTQIPSSANP